jgi:ribonuclease HI
MRRPKAKFYVVWKGRKTGIFSSWEDCAAQVQGFAGARYQSFPSRLAAEQAFQRKTTGHIGEPVPASAWLFSPGAPVRESWCVDAACSGSPGPLEYRGIDLRSGREIFHKGPYQHGTNNVGEFLAIVQALVLLKKQKSDLTVYSDSATAIGWVKKKHCNTGLAADVKNASLFALIAEAEDWLAGQPYSNPILKWDTQAWGEIPADFKRK